MSTRNPILAKATGTSSGYGDFAYDPNAMLPVDELSAISGQVNGARLTLDDVIVKTGLLLALVIAGAGAGWLLMVSMPAVVLGSFVIALVLGLVNAFKREVSPALVLTYAVFEGIFLGGISRIYDLAYAENAPNLVGQAVIGTLVAFATMLALYSTGTIKATGKFQKIFMTALVSYGVLALASLVSSFFGVGDGWGFYGVGGLGLALCALGVLLAAFSLVMDFEAVAQGIAQGLPERESWRMGFGLIMSLVWLYTELLRLLAILNDD
jgi:uncharacterized YccA/Bax inhibitor family protein